MSILLIILVGLVSGFLSGLLGIGGGIIMVPLFYYLLGMELTLAIGTSLAIIIPTALAGSITHWHFQHVDLKIAIGVALFAVIGSIIGAAMTVQLATPFLKKILALLLIIAAVKLFIDK